MGQPVVHFEVFGKDGERLQGFYSDMFGWEIDSDNPMNYGLVSRDQNTSPDGIGIGGGIGSGQEGQSYVTFYVSVDDVEAGLQKAESLGGSRVMGPMEVMDQLTIGLFNDPEGHMIGLVNTQSAE